MLKTLDFTVQFEKTGRTIEQSITFQKGFGAITGPNESGKSLVLEMIRYGLFGSRALRGSTSDYRNLSVCLVISLRGNTYTVIREKSTMLFLEKDEIAVGVKPVNTKIVEILGFGLEVFDISCVVMQGEVERLGAMGGADRKRLVDSVIGLSVIEDMIRVSNDEANSVRRTIEVLEKDLQAPIAPLRPEGYTPDYQDKYRELQALRSEYDQLVGTLSRPPALPDYVPEYTGPNIEEIEHIAKQQLQEKADILYLKRAIHGKRAPLLSKEEIEEKQANWGLYQERCRTEADIVVLEAELRQVELHTMTCPKCNEEIPHSPHAIEKLKNQIDAKKKQLVPVDKPDWSLQALEIERENLTYPDYAATLLDMELDQMAYPDYATALSIAKVAIDRRARYERDLETYEKQQRPYVAAQKRANELREKLGNYDDQQATFKLYAQYDTLATNFMILAEWYKDTLTNIAGLKDQRDDWIAAKEALTTLRTNVKQHLLPALNRWSSAVLSQMTGRQRNNIVVDEDFEITVDNQPLHTLSGSGKAVANLALRIGLGQVLTNGVLSLFIGDEIDASMDTDRAENTALALQTLKDSILQILLVSHKSIEADYYINLGNDND